MTQKIVHTSVSPCHCQIKMSNIAQVLKTEIARIAKKEVRGELESLKKASSKYRSDIAALKKQVAALEQRLSKQEKQAGKAATQVEKAADQKQVRFSANGLKKFRERIELSAPALAKLLNVSAPTIYSWESGSTRPRQEQLLKLVEVRRLGKREIKERLG